MCKAMELHPFQNITTIFIEGGRGIPQEGNNLRKVDKTGGNSVQFPVSHRRFSDPQGQRNVLLQKSEVQAALPDMVTQGCQGLRVSCILRLFG